MDEHPDDETDRAGIRCGCLAAMLFAVPAACVLLLATTLGDCFEGDPCRGSYDFPIGLAAVLALAAAIGFAARAVGLWWARRRLGDPGAVPVWAMIVLAPLALLALWCAWGMLPLFFS